MALIVLKNPPRRPARLKRGALLRHYLLQKDNAHECAHFPSICCRRIMSTFVSSHSRDAFAPAPSAAMNTHLNLEQYLELLLGPNDDTSAFDSDESRRQAWRD